MLTPPGHPYGPRRRPTVGSYEGAVSYERGTPLDFSSEVPDNGSKELLQVHHPRHRSLGMVLLQGPTEWRLLQGELPLYCTCKVLEGAIS